MRFLAIFLSLVHRIDFKLHIMIVLNDLDNWAHISTMLDHSKITEMPCWMIQRAKNEVFGHFLEFCALDRLENAYFGFTKWSWHVGCHVAHAGSFRNHKNAFLGWSKEPKMFYFHHFLELALLDRLDITYFDFTKWAWHIGCQITLVGSFKNQKNAFLDDPKS